MESFSYESLLKICKKLKVDIRIYPFSKELRGQKNKCKKLINSRLEGHKRVPNY